MVGVFLIQILLLSTHNDHDSLFNILFKHPDIMVTKSQIQFRVKLKTIQLIHQLINQWN